MKLGKIRHAALAGVMSLALVGAWVPVAQADETLPPADPSVTAEDRDASAAPGEESNAESYEEAAMAEPSISASDEASTQIEPTVSTRQMSTQAPASRAASCVVTANVAGTKAFGSGSSMWGSATNCSGTTVAAQVYVDGSWVHVGSTSLNSNNGYAMSIQGATARQGSHKLRAVVNGTASPTVTQYRYAKPTFNFASPKLVGEGSNVWGTFEGAGRVSVWTEALVGGKWLTSQKGTTNAYGGYALPLTYGQKSSGTHSFRVAARYADGSIARTEPFKQVRLALPTANTAGTQRTGVASYVWGTFSGGSGIAVWTEAKVGTQWLTSQRGTTNQHGGYSLPLTFGQNEAGQYQYRVAAKYPDGRVVRTAPFTFTRTKPALEGIDKRCLTGRVLCASKTTNKMHWMIDGKILETVDVRYGRPGLETREGQFQVNWKSRNHVSSLYGSAMPFSMFFSGGQAVHYSSDFATRGWVGGSAGCINVRDWNTLERIYNQVRVGDKVVVYW